MKKIKIIIGIFVISLIGIAVMTVGLSAYSGNDDGLNIYVSNGEASVAYVDDSISGHITIPSTFEGYPVTRISHNAFDFCKSLTSVTIPDSVTSIGMHAFYGCTSLKSVIIPDSVTSIGSSAFGCCRSLTSVRIPDSVTNIDEQVFYLCERLESVEIGDSVTSIGKEAFANCFGLHTIDIPDSVTSIGDKAFAYCRLLTSVIIPDSVTSIGKGAFADCDSLRKITFYSEQTTIYSSIYSSGETIPNRVTIYCYAGNTAVQKYAQENRNTVVFLPCKNGCTYENIVDDAYIKSVGSCTKRAVYYKLCSGCKRPSDTLTFEADFTHSFIEQNISDAYLKAPATCISKAIYYYCCDNCTAKGTDTYEYGSLGKHTFSGDHETICDVCGYDKSLFVTVTYDANGGNPIPSSQTMAKGSSITISSSTPTRSGYKFQGWATNVVGEVKYNSGSSFTPTEDVTLYAMWLKTCTTCSGTGKMTEKTDCTSCFDGYRYTTSSCSNCGGDGAIWVTQACPLRSTNGGICYNGTLMVNGVVYGKCSSCGGDGIFETPANCSKCSGTGKVSYATSYCGGCAGKSYKENSVTCSGCAGKCWNKISPAVVAPTPILESQSVTQIVLAAVEGCEYSKDGETWQTSPIFNDLPAGTHTFYQRYMETATTIAGQKSEGLVVEGLYRLGDCDGNEEVTIDDAIYLAFYTFYPDRYQIPNGMNVDFNKDGEVTVDDAIYLAFYTFYPDRYPLN